MFGFHNPLVVRSVRARPLIALLIFLLSAAAVATSVLGPLLVRALHQSTLQSAVAQAGAAGTWIVVSADQPPEVNLDVTVGQVQRALSSALTESPHGLWRPLRTHVESSTSVVWTVKSSRPESRSSRAAVVEPGCVGYVLVSGACPSRAGDVGVSVEAARRAGIRLGSVVTVAQPAKGSLRVTALYDAGKSLQVPLIWRSSEGRLEQKDTDHLLMTAQDFARFSVGATASAQLLLNSTIRVQDEPEVRRVLAAARANLLVPDAILELDSELPGLLDDVERQVQAAQVLVWVSVVQALALSLFACAVMVARLSRARAAEWGIGRLRGIPRWRWLLTIYAEPGLALLVGLPVGVVAGAALARYAIAHNLAVIVPVEVGRWPVMVAAGSALVGAGLALLVVGVRSARRPLAELLAQAAEPRQVTVAGAVVQTAVVLLAGTTLYQLVSGGLLRVGGSLLGLFAPALFALALAMLTVRVAVAGVARRFTHRPARSLAGLVVGRQAARTPSALTPAMAVAVGLALAVFATQLFVLSMRNQGLRAQAIVGADTVLRVSVPPSVDLVAAVRDADPSGRFAMAARETSGDYGGTSHVLAVDSSRLAAVAPWSPGWLGVADPGSTLRQTSVPPMVLTGSRVEIAVAKVKMKTASTDGLGISLPPSGLAAPPSLVLTVESSGAWQAVDLGPLERPGSYRAAIPCRAGCRLVQLGLQSVTGVAYDASFIVASLRTDQQPASVAAGWLQAPENWRERFGDRITPFPPYTATPNPTPEGLEVHAHDEQGDNLNPVVSGDADDPLPAILAPDTAVQEFPGLSKAVTGTGLDRSAQLLSVVGRASVLPRVLDDGVLVDLTNASRLSDPAGQETSSQVWLAPGAPESIEQSLATAGIGVQGRELLSQTRSGLQQGAVTRAAALARWIGYSALLLTLVTLLVTRLADAARRRADWASLRASGLAAATIRRMAALEIAGPAMLGALIGLLSGVAAVRLAAPRLSLVDEGAPHPPLDFGIAWTPVLILGLATAAAIGVVAWVGAREETRVPRAH